MPQGDFQPAIPTPLVLTAAGPTRADSPVFAKTELNLELRQGEILSRLSQLRYDFASQNVIEEPHEYAVIASQDCDLLQDFRATGASRDLNEVLLFEADPADAALAQISSDLRRRARGNQLDRYHVLEACPPSLDLKGGGIPALLVDFKRYFTLPAKELFRQVSAGPAERRSRLEVPYREQFQSRLAAYMARIALPLPHNV